MITQKQINYDPHSRPKKYYLMLSQFRSGVGWTTFSDTIKFPKDKGFVPWKGLAILLTSFALAFLLLYFGYLEGLKKLF